MAPPGRVAHPEPPHDPQALGQQTEFAARLLRHWVSLTKVSVITQGGALAVQSLFAVLIGVKQQLSLPPTRVPQPVPPQAPQLLLQQTFPFAIPVEHCRAAAVGCLVGCCVGRFVGFLVVGESGRGVGGAGGLIASRGDFAVRSWSWAKYRLLGVTCWPKESKSHCCFPLAKDPSNFFPECPMLYWVAPGGIWQQISPSVFHAT